MYRNLIILPDGTEIFSGTGTKNAIKSATLTECVNDSDELSLGSVCANALEMTIITPAGGLSLTAGDEVTLYKVDDNGVRTAKGIFILEKPTRPTANTVKIIGYDRVTKLDKDLTAWVNALTGWPYTLKTFAGMVCEACGLTLAETDIPNADFPVSQFTRSDVTGRQLMKWIGQICCRFCRATADGKIEFAWYKPSGITIAPTGERYYFQGALSYETYQVAPIDAVQLKLADSDNGALWPEADDGANSYVITDNAILMAKVTDDLLPYLQAIEGELEGVTYTPCKVAVPACLDITAGNTVDIVDKNGATIAAYVMTKTTTGQKDTLECTGSARRDSTTATNNKSTASVAATAAQNAFTGLTQQQVFNKLTNNGEIQGIYVQDSRWYINAEYAQIINLRAGSITTGKLSSANGTSYFDLDNNKFVTGDITATGGTIGGCSIVNGVLQVPAANITGTLTAGQIDATDLKVKAANITGTFTVKNTSGSTLLSAGGNAVTIGGWKVDTNSLYSGNSFAAAECFLCTGSSTANPMSIGGSPSLSGWMLKAGSNLGVTKAGALYAADAYIKGKIEANSGAIGDWNVGEVTASQGTVSYSGNAIYSDPYTDLEEKTETTVYLFPQGVCVQYRDSNGESIMDFATWRNIVKAANA